MYGVEARGRLGGLGVGDEIRVQTGAGRPFTWTEKGCWVRVLAEKRSNRIYILESSLWLWCGEQTAEQEGPSSETTRQEVPE